MQLLMKTATDQQKLAIDRNAKYYSGLTQRFSPGDLVFAFTERKGDPTPHRPTFHFYIPGERGYGEDRDHAIPPAPDSVEARRVHNS